MKFVVNDYFIENTYNFKIANLFEAQTMPQHWLEREFTRTGLPKSALASYLGVDNAAISRTISGERHLSPEETDLTQAFFSIVAQDTQEGMTDAIRNLRSTKTREAASLMLSKWLVERINPLHPELIALLEPVVAQDSTLRTDQIVALCRVLEIDVFGLVQGYDVRSRRWPEHGGSEDVLALLRSEAQRWVRPGRVPYQFDRAVETAVPRLSAAKTNFVTLQPADPAGDELNSCIAYLIPDDFFAPRFEQGQTIFLDANTEPRKGDYVAAVVKDSNSEDTKAVLGKLLYVSRDQIGIEYSRNNRVEVARREVTDLRRIAFCKM
jgi:hypothetical protein